MNTHGEPRMDAGYKDVRGGEMRPPRSTGTCLVWDMRVQNRPEAPMAGAPLLRRCHKTITVLVYGRAAFHLFHLNCLFAPRRDQPYLRA